MNYVKFARLEVEVGGGGRSLPARKPPSKLYRRCTVFVQSLYNVQPVLVQLAQ